MKFAVKALVMGLSANAVRVKQESSRCLDTVVPYVDYDLDFDLDYEVPYLNTEAPCLETQVPIYD